MRPGETLEVSINASCKKCFQWYITIIAKLKIDYRKLIDESSIRTISFGSRLSVYIKLILHEHFMASNVNKIIIAASTYIYMRCHDVQYFEKVQLKSRENKCTKTESAFTWIETAASCETYSITKICLSPTSIDVVLYPIFWPRDRDNSVSFLSLISSKCFMQMRTESGTDDFCICVWICNFRCVWSKLATARTISRLMLLAGSKSVCSSFTSQDLSHDRDRQEITRPQNFISFHTWL